VEDLELLPASKIEDLLEKKILKMVPYARLLKEMKQRGFSNVPSVSTCPATPSRLKCPETTHPEGSCSSHARTLRRGALAT
jgi:hypothetical protein